MSEQHLDLLAITARLRECRRFGERAGSVSGFLVDAARDSPRTPLWTAARLEQAATTIEHTREVNQRSLSIVDQPVLFVQAAWVVLIKPKSWERHGLKPWIKAAKKRLHRNVLAIALANKLARIARSVLARGRNFEARTNTNATAQAA